jgi:hypothetical protein
MLVRGGLAWSSPTLFFGRVREADEPPESSLLLRLHLEGQPTLHVLHP